MRYTLSLTAEVAGLEVPSVDDDLCFNPSDVPLLAEII
jgi:hypothetical protein